jgi:hypothetical protein
LSFETAKSRMIALLRAAVVIVSCVAQAATRNGCALLMSALLDRSCRRNGPKNKLVFLINVQPDDLFAKSFA